MKPQLHVISLSFKATAVRGECLRREERQEAAHLGRPHRKIVTESPDMRLHCLCYM